MGGLLLSIHRAILSLHITSFHSLCSFFQATDQTERKSTYLVKVNTHLKLQKCQLVVARNILEVMKSIYNNTAINHISSRIRNGIKMPMVPASI